MSQKKSPQPEKNQLTGEDSFRLLFSSHPIPMLLVDLKTLAFLDVNDAALKKYGYTRDEFLKFNLRDIHASDRSGEQRHHLKNGEIIDMEVTSHPFEFEGQKMTLMMAQDITRRKQAENVSLESKLTAERYLNIAAEIIVSLDNEGNITHLNESGYQLLGYKTGLVGKNWFDTCIPKEEREEVRRFFEMLGRDEVQNMESRENNVITSNGEKKTVLWHNTILRDAEDRFVGTLSSGDDITNRIEMEKTLRIALAKYKTLFEHFPLGVTIADGAGNILETNPAAAKLLAVPRDKHAQRSIDGAEWHIIRPDGTPMPPEEYASVRALKENGLIENVEMGIFKPDHLPTWLSVSAVPIPLEGQGVVITYSDISARKKTEDLLKARLRISLFSESHTLDELLQKTLDEAEVLTSSKIGFAHFVQANQRMLELQMWSTNTVKNMCSAEGKGEHYSVDKAGVWADCVYTRAPIIHNDYANLPHRKGLPEGHAPVIRELVVPIIRNEVIVAIFGVGNKPSNYTNDDVDTVLELANLAWDIIQRKRAEEALKVSEKKYRMLHESMMDGFVRVDMDGTILDCNHHYMDMLGYSKDEMVSLNYVDITPQKWHAIETDIVENQILKRGYSDVYEKEYRRKDGSTFPAELHTVLMRDEHGKPVGMWAIVRDITERKRAEKVLQESESRFRTTLQEVQTIAVQGYAIDGTTQYWNSASENLYGYSAQEAIGKNLLDLIIPPEMREQVRQSIQLMVKTGQPIPMEELSLMRKDGSRVSVYSSHVIVPVPGHTPELFCLDVDLSERKRVEKALRESEARNRALVDAMPDLLFVQNREGVYVDYHATKSHLLATPPDFFLGHTPYDVLPRDLADALQSKLDLAFQTGDIQTFEYTLELADSMHYFETRINAYNDDRVLSVIRDVTERKQAEEALRENQELFSLFMKHSPIYAFIKEVTPTASRVLQASENYEQMIGIPGRDMMGKTMEELFPAESAAKFTADDRAVISNGQVLKLDEELNGRNYTTIKFPIVQGDKTLLAGYTIDITERKLAEKEIETANIELKASLIREQRLAHTDMLTGVNNRRNLYEIAVHELEIAMRYHQPLSLMMFDLDHFKKVNDTFGHAVGDQILVQVTQSAVMELRSADSIGRYGGEEFVVLLPMTNAQQAFSLAERIRERVAQSRTATPIGDAFVTLSIGIVEMAQTTGQGETLDDLIRCADRAMYAAKQSGRNRSIIFNPNATETTSKDKS